MTRNKSLLSHLNDSNLLWFSLVLAFIVLMIIPASREIWYDSFSPGDQAYYDMRVAGEIIDEKGWPDEDELSFSSIRFHVTPYHFVLAFFGSMIGLVYASLFLPVFFGMMAVLFFVLSLKGIVKNIKIRGAVILLFISSPIFFYVFNMNGSLAFLMSIIFAFFYFYNRNSNYSLFSLLFLVLVPFFGIIHSIVLFCILVVLALWKFEEKRNLFIASVFILLFVSLSMKIPNVFKNSMVGLDFFKIMFSDLGAVMGFSIFVLLMFAVGLLTTWKDKYKLWSLYIFVVLLLVGVLFVDNTLNIYLNVLVSVFAGAGFAYLIKMRWKLKFIKKAAVFLLLLGILFSAVSFISRIAVSDPSLEFIEGMEFFEIYDVDGGKVLSSSDNGLMIQYFSGLSTVIDSNYYLFKRNSIVVNDIDVIFQLRHMKTLLPYMKKYDIKYIVIDDEMKNGGVWYRNDQGLLFVLENSEKFKSIYKNTGIEVWEYTGRYDLEAEK